MGTYWPMANIFLTSLLLFSSLHHARSNIFDDPLGVSEEENISIDQIVQHLTNLYASHSSTDPNLEFVTEELCPLIIEHLEDFSSDDTDGWSCVAHKYSHLKKKRLLDLSLKNSNNKIVFQNLKSRFVARNPGTQEHIASTIKAGSDHIKSAIKGSADFISTGAGKVKDGATEAYTKTTKTFSFVKSDDDKVDTSRFGALNCIMQKGASKMGVATESDDCRILNDEVLLRIHNSIGKPSAMAAMSNPQLYWIFQSYYTLKSWMPEVSTKEFERAMNNFSVLSDHFGLHPFVLIVSSICLLWLFKDQLSVLLVIATFMSGMVTLPALGAVAVFRGAMSYLNHRTLSNTLITISLLSSSYLQIADKGTYLDSILVLSIGLFLSYIVNMDHTNWLIIATCCGSIITCVSLRNGDFSMGWRLLDSIQKVNVTNHLMSVDYQFLSMTICLLLVLTYLWSSREVRYDKILIGSLLIGVILYTTSPVFQASIDKTMAYPSKVIKGSPSDDENTFLSNSKILQRLVSILFGYEPTDLWTITATILCLILIMNLHLCGTLGDSIYRASLMFYVNPGNLDKEYNAFDGLGRLSVYATVADKNLFVPLAALLSPLFLGWTTPAFLGLSTYLMAFMIAPEIFKSFFAWRYQEQGKANAALKNKSLDSSGAVIIGNAPTPDSVKEVRRLVECFTTISVVLITCKFAYMMNMQVNFIVIVTAAAMNYVIITNTTAHLNEIVALTLCLCLFAWGSIAHIAIVLLAVFVFHFELFGFSLKNLERGESLVQQAEYWGSRSDR